MRLSCGCDKAVGVSLNRESVRTPEVDVVMTDGSDVSQGIDGIPGCRALTFALNGALHRVRHRFSVSHQCQCRAAAEALLAGLVDTSFPGMAVINRRVHRCVDPRGNHTIPMPPFSASLTIQIHSHVGNLRLTAKLTCLWRIAARQLVEASTVKLPPVISDGCSARGSGPSLGRDGGLRVRREGP